MFKCKLYYKFFLGILISFEYDPHFTVDANDFVP